MITFNCFLYYFFFYFFTSEIMNFISKFSRNTRAIGLMTIGMAVIGLVIGLTVAAELLPDAIVDITCSTSYAGAPAAVITMMTTVLGIVIAAAVVLLILKFVRK